MYSNLIEVNLLGSNQQYCIISSDNQAKQATSYYLEQWAMMACYADAKMDHWAMKLFEPNLIETNMRMHVTRNLGCTRYAANSDTWVAWNQSI